VSKTSLGQQPGIRCFRSEKNGLNVIFCDVPGPLCSAAVVVLTEPLNDYGLPHTLEHLVFCGSKTTPLRGFLDTFATRCLSEGTNAWTSEDHTAYTIETVGHDAMRGFFFFFFLKKK